MNKKFFAVYFSVLCMLALPSYGSVRLITEQPKPSEQRDFTSQEIVDTSSLPNPNDEEEVKKYFKKRLENADVTVVPQDVDMSEPSSFDIIHTPEYYAAQEEKNKPLFQKMYEEALRSLHDKENSPYKSSEENDKLIAAEKQAAQTATRFFTLAQTEQKIQNENIATVSFSLPSGKRTLAPAVEHIPYMLSYIDIQANGYLKIEDTIVVVANNNKFAQAIQRIFPKYSYKRNGKKQHIDLILDNVTINGTVIPYTLEEIGDDIYIKPKYKQKLEPGVYTYKFSYLVNRFLQRQGQSVVMNWNIIGRPINAFITSANAIVTIPSGHNFQSFKTIIGKDKEYSDHRTNIYKLAKNVVAFSNFTPVMNGENMNVLIAVDKNALMPDFDKGYNNFLSTWGNIFYTSLALIAILLSFLLSLYDLKKNKQSAKYKPSYNGSIIRNLLIGKYDRIAFIAQLLDLYRKNAIDIVAKENKIFLQKKQNGLTKLNKYEKKAIKCLFGRKSEQTEINNNHNIAIKKARNIFDKYQKKLINKQHLVQNLWYIVFSFAMLLIAEIFIAINSINFAQNMLILLVSTVLYIFYTWIIFHRFKSWYISLPIKVLSLLAIFATWVFSSVYIGGWAEFLIVATVGIIFAFTKIFKEHNNFINEAKEAISSYKEYLISNADAINLSRDFINQQANIFALNINEYFPQNVTNKNFYKLDIAEALKEKLIGII